MITNDADLDCALKQLDTVWAANPGDSDWAERCRLIAEITAYEDTLPEPPPPSPEAAIAFRKDQESGSGE